MPSPATPHSAPAAAPGPFTAGIVGAAGIGGVHARELTAAGCTGLSVVGRGAASAAATAARLGHLLQRPVQGCAALADLVARRPDFISICSPTGLHEAHVRALSASGAFLLVEKPFFWSEGLTRDAAAGLANDLFDLAGGRLAVNHPTRHLVAAFLAAGDRRKPPREIAFRYVTRGKYVGREIAVDLLPHALSALLAIADATGAPIGPLADPAIRCERNEWQATGRFGDVAFRFDFAQDPARDGSDLSFAIDGEDVGREQVADGAGFRVFLVTAGRRIAVPNPMSVAVGRAVAGMRNGGVVPGERDFAARLMALMADLMLEA